MKKILLSIYILFSLVGCLGKVEDANSALTRGVNVGEGVIGFDGIIEATPISGDKVDVYFYPVQNLDATEVTYVINYDGAPYPIFVPGQTLIPDYRGYLKYTIEGLSINQSYLFNVQAVDTFGASSVNDALANAQTFGNETANFAGIANVRNLAGADGKNSLLVEWPAAEKIGGFIPDDIDPTQYEVILINSNFATPVAFDDSSFLPPVRVVNYVSGSKVSHQVNGLQPGTIYYVRVRAVHHGYGVYGADPTYYKEENSDYIVAETLSDNSSNILVDLTSFNVERPNSKDGLSSFNLSWSAGVGAVDHYRVYYKESSTGAAWSSYKNGHDDVCDGVETSDSAYYCKKLSFNLEATKIVELDPYTDYEVYLLMCLNSICSSGNFVEYDSSSVYSTSPPVANFSGINDYLFPRYYWAKSSIYLTLDQVDFATGVMDGILVEAKARATGAPLVDTFINHPTAPNSTGLEASSINLYEDSEISVSGIDVNATEQYCFSLVPYVIIDSLVTPDRTGEKTVCETPRVLSPSVLEFSGIDSFLYDSGSSSASMNWSEPSAGVYDTYVIFVKYTGGGFNFSDAVNDTDNSDYLRYEVPYGTTSFTLPFMPAGNYTFGVVSWLEQEDIYSEYNSNIRNVVVP